MSNSKIMNEFWGLVGSHAWAFVIGMICGMLLILFMQNRPDEPQPMISIPQIQPQPGYIPQGL